MIVTSDARGRISLASLKNTVNGKQVDWLGEPHQEFDIRMQPSGWAEVRPVKGKFVEWVRTYGLSADLVGETVLVSDPGKSAGVVGTPAEQLPGVSGVVETVTTYPRKDPDLGILHFRGGEHIEVKEGFEVYRKHRSWE